MVPLFGAAYDAPNKGTSILYCFRSPKKVLNPPVNSKVQGFFKALECFSSTFQGKVNFHGLFKTVLYIQVLFKPVQTLYKQYSHISAQTSMLSKIVNSGTQDRKCCSFKVGYKILILPRGKSSDIIFYVKVNLSCSVASQCISCYSKIKMIH